MANLENIAKSLDSKSIDQITSRIGDSIEELVDRPSRLRWFLFGAALGALGVIFLDPKEGANRRKVVREKAMDLGGKAQRFGQEQWQNIQDKASSMKNQVEEAEPTRH